MTRIADEEVSAHGDVYAAVVTPRHTSNELSCSSPTQPLEEGSLDKSVTCDSSSTPMVSLSALFQFADRHDHVLMLLGTVGSIGVGLCEPIQLVLFGDVINSFNLADVTGGTDMSESINTSVLQFVYIGFGGLLAGFLQVSCWSTAGARQAKRLRAAYVKALLSKDIGWFDVHEPMQLPAKVASSAVAMQEAVGSKLGDTIRFLAMGASGVIIGLVKGWELALVMIAFTPFLALSGHFAMKIYASQTQAASEAYAQAGAVAHEALASVRTVQACNADHQFVEQYQDALQSAIQAGVKKSVAVGLGMGFTLFVMLAAYAGGVWYGAVLVADDLLAGECTGSGCYNGGKVVTVFFAIIAGAMAAGLAGPCVEAIVEARAATYDAIETINSTHQSAIDTSKDTGKRLERVEGCIELDRVSFAYPARPDVLVCRNYSLQIAAGETVAFVGTSGSGKSTVVALLERFYDPQNGVVRLDGHDVRELNLRWLREQIGLVGQEPTLFATSILENIRHGKSSASDEEVIAAAKRANAYDFIQAFKEGFDTQVGERGTHMSGGQKQRLAIARAILRDPAVLLLDEATSALDSESERLVQQSLDRLLASRQRTTVVVAHRLSTIRWADRVAVHRDGAIVELGPHTELMQINGGVYRAMVEAQEAVETTKPPTKPNVSRGSSEALEERQTTPQETNGFTDSDDTNEKAAETTLDENELPPVPRRRLWALSAPEWPFAFIGALGATANGAVYPVWGIFMAKVTVLYFRLDLTRDEMVHDAQLWALGALALGVVFALSTLLQHGGLGVVAQRLTARVRLLLFRGMLRQDIAWFDQPLNASGALTARLTADTAVLQAATADTLNQGLLNVTTLVVGLVVSFSYSWRMTLGLLASGPVLALATFLEAAQMSGALDGNKSHEADAKAGALLGEALGSVRTVASLGLESQLVNAYSELLQTSQALDTRAALVAGSAFGASQGLLFWVLAFVFWLGGHWVSDGTETFEDVFLVMNVITLSAVAVAMAAQDSTASKQAEQAAARVFAVIDRTPDIDISGASGQEPKTLAGRVSFNDVRFAYPSRLDTLVYRDFSLEIAAGQTVALVGASGSGKSSALALLERFYDPLDGTVQLDDQNVRELNVRWLRDRVALVSQEPTLFSGSVADNIALGRPDATREEVEQAARQAGAADFINNFPQGYDTPVGPQGAQVSGGQKQRLAIARALLRDPRILLLDEATSALDAESERLVQQSLDRLVTAHDQHKHEYKTVVIVAHRLSTVRRADIILVLQDGVIVERGTHEQLMQHNARGVYRALLAAQTHTEMP